MAYQSTTSDQNQEPRNRESYTVTYFYQVLNYLWTNPTCTFLRPRKVIVDSISGYMHQRTSSLLPKTRAWLVKTKTTAMTTYHHLYQANCNRMPRPVLVSILLQNRQTTKTPWLLVTITIHRMMSPCCLMMMHQPRVPMRLLRQLTSRSSPSVTYDAEERRSQRHRRALRYDVPGQLVYYPAVTTNIHSVSGTAYPAPVLFGMRPPCQPLWHWPQYGLPIQPMYYVCA